MFQYPRIKENDFVWAKHKSNRFYKGLVLTIKKVSQCFIYFPCEKCFLSDINFSDVQWQNDKETYPPIGHVVKIKNNANCSMANQVGKFLGMNSYDLFTVRIHKLKNNNNNDDDGVSLNVNSKYFFLVRFQIEFEDKSTIDIKREFIYTSADSISQRLSSKIMCEI